MIRLIAGASALSLVMTAAFGVCYVCPTTCDVSGLPCSASADMTICEQEYHEAVSGEHPSYVSISLGEKDARCYHFQVSDDDAWRQRPCSQGSPGLGWHPVPSCGLEEGMCCWSTSDYKDASYQWAGYKIHRCGVFLCQVPINPE